MPGPAGKDGNNGANGSNGKNAFTTTTANFTVPAVSGTVTIAVVDSTWIANGQELFVTTAGYFLSNGKPDGTHVTLFNQGYTGNAAPGTVITNPQQVSPGGLKGTDGTGSLSTLNTLSPTVQKGDLIVDNGANAPAASDVRLGVGTNGQALVADSTQPTGLAYRTITPNTVTNANDIPRFSGTGGTPMPLKDSKLLITDDGAIQSTPTGGNARGSKAVDLQVDRAANAQVASGANSGILAGKNNTAAGANSWVGGGTTNSATGASSGVACGNTNTAGNTNDHVGGGSGNQASGPNASVSGGNNNSALNTGAHIGGGENNANAGQDSTICGGSGNEIDTPRCFIGGGQNNRTNADSSSIIGGSGSYTDKFGQVAHASGVFAVQGDAQHSRLLARNHTVDATSTPLFVDGTSLFLTVPINTAWAFTGTVLGRTSAGVCGFYTVSGGIKNNGGVTSLIGAVTVAVAVADGGWPGGASVTITADVVNNALKIAVVGAVATLCRWVANLDIVEVSY